LPEPPDALYPERDDDAVARGVRHEPGRAPKSRAQVGRDALRNGGEVDGVRAFRVDDGVLTLAVSVEVDSLPALPTVLSTPMSVILSLFSVPDSVPSPPVPVLTAAKVIAERASRTAPTMTTSNTNLLVISRSSSKGLSTEHDGRSRRFLSHGWVILL
jgi:hypothetical protein